MQILIGLLYRTFRNAKNS